MSVLWLAEHADDGEVSFRLGCDGDDVIAEWLGLARLVARRDGSASRLEIVPGSDPRAVAKIERGSVRLLLRHLTGELALHGAAVARGSRAVVLLGRSGDGKSTLAAWLCARTGAVLLADDATAIDETADHVPAQHGQGVLPRWVVLPAESDHWLDEPARSAVGLHVPAHVVGAGGKAPVAAARSAVGGAALRGFVALVFSDITAPRWTRLRDVDAIATLVPQTVRFVLDDPAAQRRELDRLAALVETVPVYRLERSRDLAQLDATGALVDNVLLGESKECLP
jgi:ABC-type uncharacterized transport system YnjBCD ATPase subunit